MSAGWLDARELHAALHITSCCAVVLPGGWIQRTCTLYVTVSLPFPSMWQFEKSWVVANTGTKKWKHVRLVHQVGYTPLSTEVEVPDLRPEEQTILTVEYPPIGRGQPDQITR